MARFSLSTIYSGSFERFTPRFVKQYARPPGRFDALTSFRDEVEKGIFPGPEHGFAIDEQEVEKLKSPEQEETFKIARTT